MNRDFISLIELTLSPDSLLLIAVAVPIILQTLIQLISPHNLGLAAPFCCYANPKKLPYLLQVILTSIVNYLSSQVVLKRNITFLKTWGFPWARRSSYVRMSHLIPSTHRPALGLWIQGRIHFIACRRAKYKEEQGLYIFKYDSVLNWMMELMTRHKLS